MLEQCTDRMWREHDGEAMMLAPRCMKRLLLQPHAILRSAYHRRPNADPSPRYLTHSLDLGGRAHGKDDPWQGRRARGALQRPQCIESAY